MKANELRIGNYISFIDRTGEVHIPQTHPLKVYNVGVFKIEVCQIDEHFAQVEKMIVLENWELTPIPLTEEWLLKFCFERDLELERLESGKTLKQYKFGNQNEHKFVRVCVHPVGGFTLSFHGAPLTKPKFVHKLQNTVYELIDKELIDKELIDKELIDKELTIKK